MAHFTDSKKRRWTIRITPYVMREVRAFCDVDLGTIMQENMKPLADLLNSDIDFCSTLYAICKDEADSKNIDCKDFLDGIVGDCIDDATEAFLEGLQEMYPTRNAKRLAVIRRLAKQSESKQKKQIDAILTELTRTEWRSRWAAFWASIRRILLPKKWAT